MEQGFASCTAHFCMCLQVPLGRGAGGHGAAREGAGGLHLRQAGAAVRGGDTARGAGGRVPPGHHCGAHQRLP